MSRFPLSCSFRVLYHVADVGCNSGGLDPGDNVFEVWKGEVFCRSYVAEEVTAV